MTNIDQSRLADIKLALIHPSPTNPRKWKTGIDAAVARMKDSVREQGILQPIVVRPSPSLERDGFYEIVMGECRWRACCELHWETMPCVVRSMSDDAVLEAQHVENLHREGIDPIDEAESLNILLERVGGDGSQRYTMASLAQRLGVNHQHISNRLLLLNLSDEARGEVREGTLGLRVAEQVSRLPRPADRAAALKKVRGRPRDEALQIIAEDFMVSLVRHTPFALDDAELVPEAGACVTCPHFDLREGVGRAGGRGVVSKVCLNPKCHAEKVEAHFKRQSDEALRAGKILLSDKICREIFPGEITAGVMSPKSPYVDVSERPAEGLLKSEVKLDADETWRALLDRAEREVGGKVPCYLARDQRGVTHELVEVAVAMAAIQKAGEPLFRTNERSEPRQPDTFVEERKVAVANRKAERSELLAAMELIEAACVQNRISVGEDMSPVLAALAIEQMGPAATDLYHQWTGQKLEEVARGHSSIPSSLIPLLLMLPGLAENGIEFGPFGLLAEVVGVSLEPVDE